MALFHPEMTRIRCADCQRYTIDFEKGKICEGRDGQPIPRLSPTPCRVCPRESPDNEEATQLSPKNWRAVELYREVQATCGACLTDAQKSDPLLKQNLAIVHQIITAHSASQSHQNLATLLSQAIVTRRPL